jgi:conjugal transfer pilus assembly protein TraK
MNLRPIILAAIAFSSAIHADAPFPPDPTKATRPSKPNSSQKKQPPGASPAQGLQAGQQGTQSAARDPLAVDPGLVVKDTPALEVDLPGVMRLDGDSRLAIDPTRVRKISMSDTRGSQAVHLSNHDANRIVLPFKNPRVISGDFFELLEKKATSNSVYIGFKPNVTNPVQVFFESPDGLVLSLQLIPKAIPSQTVLVEDDSLGKPNRQPADDYITALQDLSELVALGNMPSGYAKVPQEEIPPIAFKGAVLRVKQRYSGRGQDVWVYELSNPSKTPIVLDEKEFLGDKVLAVSFFPTAKLDPGKLVDVIVIARKTGGELTR